MKRLARWMVVLIVTIESVTAVLSLLAIYRTPLSLSDLVEPQFALGFLCGGCALALIFLIGDWWDANVDEYEQ